MAKEPIGYAVIDVETTGLRPGGHDRIIEIGIVHLDAAGQATGEWSTLVNPGRDLGPQHIHGIRAADIRHAPAFEDVAGALAGLLTGRVPVAHNLRFDTTFLRQEFIRLGIGVPLDPELGICTMEQATRYLPDAPRNLAGCCAMADIPLDGHHDALVDARAAAQLLRRYLTMGHPPAPWAGLLHTAARTRWPSCPGTDARWVRRGVSAQRETHFLARILDRLPRTPHPVQADAYLALLDRVLLDHHISATEADALVELATDLGLSRQDLTVLHRDYLTALAQAALSDGVVTPAERHELALIAALLDLPPTAIDDALTAATAQQPAYRSRFRLEPGDLVVFTGEMDGGRETWENLARQAGYLPHPAVTKKVRLLIAADPDSLSGKARKARGYGIPIITPDAFTRLLT